jgi:hypothetical protein
MHVSPGETGSLPLAAGHAHDRSPAAASAASQALLQGHGHFQGESLVAHRAPSAEAAEDASAALKDHDNHAASTTTGEERIKLVPKPCTVSKTGGLIVTSTTGKRECDCPEKQLAAAEATKQIFAEDGPLGVKGLVTSVAECLPCQSSALFPGLAGELLTCPLPGSPGSSTLVLDHLSGEACPEKQAEDSAWLAAEDAGLWRGLQLVGLPLLASSIALTPALVRRKKAEENDQPAVRAVDWLFGRLNVELLMAR